MKKPVPSKRRRLNFFPVSHMLTVITKMRVLERRDVTKNGLLSKKKDWILTPAKEGRVGRVEFRSLEDRNWGFPEIALDEGRKQTSDVVFRKNLLSEEISCLSSGKCPSV